MKLALLAPLAPLVLASSLVSSVALAQAPGDYNGGGTYGGDTNGGGYGGYNAGYGAGPGMSPYAAPLPPPPPPPVRRLSVGLGVGHLSLSPHNAPDQKADFGIGEIAIRYLLGRHLELELAFAGGDQNGDNNTMSNVGVSEGVLGARWRFSPQNRWNWWLMAGMGMLTVAPNDANKDQRKALEQSTLQFGIGLERRWTRFALQAELRAVGVKKNDNTTTAPAMPPAPGGYPQSYGSDPGNPGMKGGQFALSANYYF